MAVNKSAMVVAAVAMVVAAAVVVADMLHCPADMDD